MFSRRRSSAHPSSPSSSVSAKTIEHSDAQERLPLPELIAAWDQRFQSTRSDIEAEALKLREESSRLAPRGEHPEENISPELRALGERYAENRLRLERIEGDHRQTEAMLLKALADAQELDKRLSEEREQIELELAKDREDLRSRPFLGAEIEPRIRRALRQIELIDEIRTQLHDCRWSHLRLPFNDLHDSSYAMAGLCAYAIGQDPLYGDAGVVGVLERLEQRLSELNAYAHSADRSATSYPYAI